MRTGIVRSSLSRVFFLTEFKKSYRDCIILKKKKKKESGISLPVFFFFLSNRIYAKSFKSDSVHSSTRTGTIVSALL